MPCLRLLVGWLRGSKVEGRRSRVEGLATGTYIFMAVHTEGFDLVNNLLIIILARLLAVFSIGSRHRRKLLRLLANSVKHFRHVGFSSVDFIVVWSLRLEEILEGQLAGRYDEGGGLVEGQFPRLCHWPSEHSRMTGIPEETDSESPRKRFISS